jgi:hypothetical protein
MAAPQGALPLDKDVKHIIRFFEPEFGQIREIQGEIHEFQLT